MKRIFHYLRGTMQDGLRFNPWNSLRPKTGQLLFGQFVWRKIIFFQFFLLDEWTTYFTSFPWTPSMPNSDSVWARGDVFSKTSIKLIFHVFSKELLHAAMWLKLPKGWRAGCSKISLFCPQNLGFSLFFTFFFVHCSAWCHLQCDRYDLNVKFFIFFKKFYKVHSVEVWSQDSRQQN
jgi:hypothetical protein